MSLNGIYYPHVLEFGEPPLGRVARFDDVSTDLNYEMTSQMGGADGVPCFVGATSANPSISFQTKSVRDVLATVSSNNPADGNYNVVKDLSITTPWTDAPVTMYWRKGKPMSMREGLGSGVHVETRLRQSAMLYWSSLQAREDQDVTINAMLKCGRNNPDLTEPPFKTIGTRTLGPSYCQELYSLGPVVYNGRYIGSIHEVDWQNNVSEYTRRTAASPADPCYLGVNSIAPVIRCRTNDITEFANEDPLATAGKETYGGQAISQLWVFLRRRKRTNFYYGEDEDEHILLRAFGGWKAVVGTSQTDPAESVMEFHLSAQVSSSGVVATDFLFDVKFDYPILKQPTVAAPALDDFAAVTASVGDRIEIIPNFVSGSGFPTAYALPTPGDLPAGLIFESSTGVIHGYPTGADTVNLDYEASNVTGTSPTKQIAFTIT